MIAELYQKTEQVLFIILKKMTKQRKLLEDIRLYIEPVLKIWILLQEKEHSQIVQTLTVKRVMDQ